MNSRRAWVVFGAAVFAYLIAVLHRTSLGVAVVEATERFGVTAAMLSTLAVVQIVVYALLQVPVGTAVDRVGPRFLILLGAALMCVGQTMLALAPDIGLAIAGRMLVGAGDAMTFISAIRLLATWFDGRTLPIATQLLGTSGQAGQFLSALPLAAALQAWGWIPTYLGVAALSIVAIVVVVVVVRATPVLDAGLTWRGSVRQVRDAIARPGTQLGFWAHFVSQPSMAMFAWLWGFPFLSIAVGMGSTVAATVLALIVVTAAVAGPVLGMLSARFPLRRSTIVLGIVAASVAVWIAVLLWPGVPPAWLVVLLVIVLAIGGPGSIIGFDFARTFNPLRSLGSANGVVNLGGFTSTFVMMLLVGVVLDVVDHARGGSGVPIQLYSMDSFRIAFLVQFPVLAFGVVMLLRARRQTRARLQEDEGIAVAPLWVVIVRALRRRRT